MKNHIKTSIKYIGILFALYLFQHNTYSQISQPQIPTHDSIVWTYIKTPKGDSMETAIYYGEPPEWKAFYTEEMDSLINNVYHWTNVTMLDSGTIEYNCHAYAWNISEGGDTSFLSAYTSVMSILV